MREVCVLLCVLLVASFGDCKKDSETCNVNLGGNTVNNYKCENGCCKSDNGDMRCCSESFNGSMLIGVVVALLVIVIVAVLLLCICCGKKCAGKTKVEDNQAAPAIKRAEEASVGPALGAGHTSSTEPPSYYAATSDVKVNSFKPPPTGEAVNYQDIQQGSDQIPMGVTAPPPLAQPNVVQLDSTEKA